MLHITAAAAWAAAQAAGSYEPTSLDDEGFVHCSRADQVVRVADERYRGVGGLVLLVVDPAAVGAPVVDEDSYGAGETFPHVYGPIPVAAVTEVVDFPCGPDGTFTLPALPGIGPRPASGGA